MPMRASVRGWRGGYRPPEWSECDCGQNLSARSSSRDRFAHSFDHTARVGDDQQSFLGGELMEMSGRR